MCPPPTSTPRPVPALDPLWAGRAYNAWRAGFDFQQIAGLLCSEGHIVTPLLVAHECHERAAEDIAAWMAGEAA